MTHYAKPLEGPEGTYEYHVGSCLAIASEYLDLHRKVLEELCPKWGLTFDEFALLCRRAAFFHDIGKLGDIFQGNMRDKLEGRRSRHYFRHELLSARLLYELRTKGVFPYDVWAVLGHHKKLDVGFTSFNRERCDTTPDKLTPEQIQFGLDFAEAGKQFGPQDERHRERIFNPRLFEDRENFDDEENWVVTFLSKFSDRYFSQNSSISTNRFLAALMRGILGYADWTASAKPEDRLRIRCTLDQARMNEKMRERMEGRRKPGDPEYAKRPFQAACEAVSGNILAIAPTGSGKTEASLLWATNRGPGKVLFLMPTKVTSNSIYERMRTYFDPKDCGISHSGAGVYLALKEDKKGAKAAMEPAESPEQEDSAREDAFKMLRQYKAFMAPVMVATVDQLLTANFNVGDWFFKELATMGASVVFDEIHAYEPYTLALITESIKRIKELGGRVMVMSATMPQKLREHFQEVLGVDAPIVAEELMDRRKCSWTYREEPLESFDEEILHALEQDQKVAIVVNTVKEAQRVYLRWKDILAERMPQKTGKVMCYHSNFIMRDRDEKEKNLLNEPDDEGRPSSIDLLIATQVIEVSLDISFDLMISECAPMDDLIQRAGRCNRFGRSREGRFIVFPISDVAKKYVYKDSGAILQHTMEVLQEYHGPISERDLSDMLERAYQDFNFYDESYCEGQNRVQEILNEDKQIMDTNVEEDSAAKLTTREISIVKVPVIPLNFLEDVKALLERGDRKSLYAIEQFEVPVVFCRKLPVVKVVGHTYVCEIGYDNEIGVKADMDCFY